MRGVRPPVILSRFVRLAMSKLPWSIYLPVRERSGRVAREVKLGSTSQVIMMRRLDREAQTMELASSSYALVVAKQSDIARWFNFLRDSGEFGSLTKEDFYVQVLCPLIADSAVLATFRGDIVGCASAARVAGDPSSALLSFVAVAHRHRNMRLGRALVKRVMHVCEQHGFRRILLRTDRDREAALALYRSLGFSVMENERSDEHE